MKKILFLLLSTVAMYGQVPADATPLENIQVTNNIVDLTTDRVNVPTVDGVINWKYAKDLKIPTKAFLSTGLLKNGAIMANGDPTKFNITAGIGIISNFDDPENPVSTIINFPAFTGITPTYLLTGNITYVAINSTPAVVMQVTPFTDSQRRDLIELGAVIHSNLTTINVINNLSSPSNAGTNQLHDFMDFIGALNLTGNKYSANGANLQLDKSAGIIGKRGVNFVNDWKDPHRLSQSAETALTFRYRTQNGTEGTDRINLDPALYDLNNILTAVPNNKFTIQTVVMFQTGLTRILYGQTVYDDLATARAAIFTRSFVIESNAKENGIIRGYIIMRNTTTSLLNPIDATILEAQKFGGVASGGVALTFANIVSALGYTPENVANKTGALTASSTLYPNNNAVITGLATKLNLINAKQAGAIANGIADDTAVLQSYLNNGQGTYIFPKGDYLVSGLDVNSDSKLIFEKGARLLLKNNSDRSVLQNKNFALSTDKNIEIYGLEIEGNEANQIKVSVTAPYIGEPTVGLRFFGVENLKIIGAKINKTRTYGIWLSRVTNLVAKDIEFNQSLLTIDNQDGLHINGLCYNLEIQNLRGVTNDDMIALNANDVAHGSNVSLGEIKNASIKDIVFNNNLNGIRLLSAGNLLDKVTIDNLSGNVRDNVVAISSYNLGVANFGSITINQVKVDTNTPVNVMGEYGGYILVNDKIEYLKISNVYRKVGADARPTIRIQGRADINKIEIENITSVINQALLTYYPDLSIENGSIVSNIFVSDYNLMNGVFPNGYFIGSTGGVIGKLHLNNLYVEQIGYGLYLNNTDIGTVIVDGLSTNNIRYPFYLELDSDIAALISDNNNWAYTLGTPSVYNVLDTSSIVYYNRGTPNRLVKWGSTIDEKDSVLFDDGVSIALGTTSPSGKFNIVAGSDTVPNIAFGNYLGFGWGFLERATDGNLDIRRVVSGVSTSTLLLSRSTGNATFGAAVSATSFNGGAALTGTPTATTATSGTNTTQIATTAFVNTALGNYKKYVALISQSGTAAPTVIVLENTLGGTVVWTRTSTGIYTGTLTGAFTLNKTFCLAEPSTHPSFLSTTRLDTNSITIATDNSAGTVIDGYLNNASVEIRVYNFIFLLIPYSILRRRKRKAKKLNI